MIPICELALTKAIQVGLVHPDTRINTCELVRPGTWKIEALLKGYRNQYEVNENDRTIQHWSIKFDEKWIISID
jgi:hypothetical protein